jgi:hypothetical protein
MRKDIFRGPGGYLLVVGLILALSLPALALDKRVAENPLLRHRGFAKPATAVELICAVGNIYNRISNSTVEKSSGTNDWTILMGDDSAELPSMRWQTPNNYASINDYLYYASLRMGIGDKLVHFSTDTSPGISTKTINTDTTAVSLLDTYFEIADTSSLVGPSDRINVAVHAHSYAWAESYRDDFIIYDYWILNLNNTDLQPFFIAMHADCDVSSAEGGSGAQAWSRDDLPNYYRNDATKEYISYMFDGDNTTVAGNDIGGNKLPKESTGYIGSRLLFCPARMSDPVDATGIQSGHGWWDWNSDPGTDADWMRLITDGLWLTPPPSVHDYRYLQKMGPFNIPAGDSIRLVLAFGLGEGLDNLRANLEWANLLFQHSISEEFGYRWLGPSAPATPTFTQLQAGDRQVELAWNTLAETTPDPATGELDFEGYRLWRKTGSGGNWELILESDVVDDIGLNTGLIHSYVDGDVSNGYQYYYSITAYDRGSPAAGIESFETGRGQGSNVEPGLAEPTESAEKSGIHVVPNPFVLTSPEGFGRTPTNDNPSFLRVLFVNLPQSPEVTVTIFSLTGDEIIKLTKTDPNLTTLDWDLITKSRQTVVAGVYLYVVESDAPGFEDFIGKFMVVR